MDAILNVYKPRGLSSFACVAQVRRILGETKAGHAGTLDPEAEGVLPICLGKATRCTEFFLEQGKRYRAEVLFGQTTDSRDCWGETIRTGDPSALTEHQVRTALEAFRGTISQVPPIYSAIKKDGVPLYKRALRGEDITPPARTVTIYQLELLDFWHEDGQVKASLDVQCSKGTYIRSLCHDLGEALGCGACMSALVRTAYGPYTVEEALTPAQLQEAQEAGRQDFLHPLDLLLQHLPLVHLTKEEERRYRDGKRVVLPLTRLEQMGGDVERVRVYWQGKLYAVSQSRKEREGILLLPWKFFGTGEEG